MKDQIEGGLRNSVEKTWVRQQDMKGGVIEVIGTGRGDSAQCLGQAEVCGIRLRWTWVCRGSATKLSLAAAKLCVSAGNRRPWRPSRPWRRAAWTGLMARPRCHPAKAV